MNVQECYQKMDGNYDEAVYRMGSDERIIKYLKIFQKDTNFASLCEAVKNNDYKTAFIAAHTLKGVALNLSLTSLADSTIELTEMFRGGMPGENVGSLLQNTKRAYALLMTQN